jgi:hypothetical protein
VEHLKGLATLKNLDLSLTAVTEQGVADLKRAKPSLSITR